MDKYYSNDAWTNLADDAVVGLTKGTVSYFLDSIAELQDLTTMLILTVRAMQVKSGAVELTDELEDFLKEQSRESSDGQEES